MPIINHLGLSSGKDSTAALGWIIHESGYPKDSIRLSFADTENEYDEVYTQIEALDAYAQNHGVTPIRTLHSMGFLNLCISKQRFPAAKTRFCTQHLKIIPFLHYVQELQLQGYDVVSHSGVRASESTERSVLEEYGFDHVSNLQIRRPLLKLSIQDVWDLHHKYNLPVNALYALGWKRVGCRLCCMSNKADVRRTAKLRPWVIDIYRHWESLVGNPHKTGASKTPGSFKSSFFPSNTIPAHLRSIKNLVRLRNSKRGQKGESYSACTIDDVVKWSLTLHGGKQTALDFMFQEDDSHAPCQMGYCE